MEKTTNKVQAEKTTTGTSTSTSYTINSKPQIEYGWACPRCGRINAPWKSQCDCSGYGWQPTWDWWRMPGDEWWKHVYYGSDCSTTVKTDSNGNPIVTATPTNTNNSKTILWKASSSDPDTFTVHPTDTICKSPSSTCTTTHTIVGGSDYWDEDKKEWSNIPNNTNNSTTVKNNPWDQYYTLTNTLDPLINLFEGE